MRRRESDPATMLGFVVLYLAAVIIGIFLALFLIGAENIVCAVVGGFSYCTP